MSASPPTKLPRRLRPLLACVLAGTLALSSSHASWWLPWKKEEAPQKPKQPGEDTTVAFQGNKAFSDKSLRASIEEQLQQIRKEGFTRPNIDDAAYYLSAFYQNNGYAEVVVTPEKDGLKLLLKIQEGPTFRLRKLTLVGNHSLPEKDVKSVLVSATTDRFDLDEKKLPFVLDDLQRGCSRLVDWYQLEGFLNAEVDMPKASFSADSKEADVSIEIHEGDRFGFGSVQINGSPSFEKATLLRVIDPQLKLPYNAPRVASIQSALQKFYNERAYFDASVEVSADPAEAGANCRVPVVIRVQAGQTYRFHGSEFKGLSRTQPSWMRERLLSLENQPYDPEKLESINRRLMASGLFSSLQIDPIPQPDHTLRLRVTAEESMARDIGFSLGYGSYEGVMFGIRASHRNLLGRGLHFSTELALSERTIALESTLANPWLFETPTEFISRAFIRTRYELGYDKREAGVRAEFSRKLLPHLRLATFAQTRTVEITQSDLSQADLGKTAYQVGTVGLSATLDKRNDPFHPTRGWIIGGLFDSNVLQNGNSFLRTTGRLGWHYPLPGDIGFAASARIGILSQTAQPPVDERFFLGGATTVRSFRERELGPHDSRPYPIGGSSYSLLNAELDFPLLQNLRGAFFYDTGSLSESGNKIPLSDFRSALGIGLRYALPVGPLRFDVGFNPDRKPSENWGAAHLSFGFAF